MIKCSVGICVFNEAKNIERLLASLKEQKLKNVKIGEILVITSASTDGTDKKVKNFGKKDKRIKLIKQKKREGKASAVNLFVERAENEILVLLGGDLVLSGGTLQALVSIFADPEIGMAGARPVPLNNIDDGLCGFAAHLLWELHHRVSLKDPKMGEVVAFRKVFRRIPILSSVDEANIEPLIRGQGFMIKYVPSAKIYNKAPTTIGDFIKQRRRIFSGHLAVKYEQSYEVATLNMAGIYESLISYLWDNPKPIYFLYTPLVIGMEAYSRFLGWWDYRIAKRRHNVWESIETTKDLSH